VHGCQQEVLSGGRAIDEQAYEAERLGKDAEAMQQMQQVCAFGRGCKILSLTLPIAE